MAQLAGDLRGYWDDGRPIERACYAIAGLLVLSGLFHLLVYAVDGGPWEGPVSWRKPVTFGLSFGITLASIAWVSTFVALPSRTRKWVLGLFAAASVAEVALITVQRWRGVPSHFNEETTVDTLVTRVLAVGGGIIIVTIGWLTVAAFRAIPQVPLVCADRRSRRLEDAVPPSMRLAVRTSLVTLVGALAVGGVMIAGGVVSVANGDQQGAYLHGGWLKPAHAVLMHAVTVLPLLAWIASYTGWPEDQRVRAVALGAAGYLVVAAAVTGMTLLGAVSAVGAALVLAGGVALAAAGVWTVAGAVRGPVHAGIGTR
jgi:hypothetical protein